MKNKKVEELISSAFEDAYKPAHQEGPDYVIATEKNKVWVADDPIKIRFRADSEAAYKPESVVTLFRNVVDKYPNRTALTVKRAGHFIRWTYSKYWTDVCTVAKGFIKLGLMPFHGVAILSYNIPEWFISFLGGIFSGGVGVGIYTTNSADACYYVLQDSNANILLVENEVQLEKILPLRHKLPHLKAIIQLNGQPSDPTVFSWNDLLLIGNSLPNEVLNKRIKGLAVNQCCCLVYTSGTLGDSKGVMLSHDNLTFFVRYASFKVWKFKMAREVRISYLPLSHIAALNGDLFGGIVIAAETYFAPADALKGKMADALRESKPHSLVAVPRVWEKMYEKIREAEANMPTLKKRLFTWARSQASQHHTKNAGGANQKKPTHNSFLHTIISFCRLVFVALWQLLSCSNVPLSFTLANSLVLMKIRKLLGLERAEVLICGGAPLSKDIIQYFLSLNMTITECYGLSETAGPHSIHLNDDYRLGSVGRILPEYEIKIANADESGNGEILMRGRNVFMGYLHMEDKTRETLDDDGWMHSGDIGYLDRNNFLFVTGRIKELLVTSGGENVAPIPIENEIKKALPIVNNCMVIGDQRKFLSMVLTLKTELDLNTLKPQDDLTQASIAWCKSVGSDAKTVSQVISGPDSKVYAAIQQGINFYNNNKAISRAQRIQKWIILPKDFSVPGGEIGPSLKLKRHMVLKEHFEAIEAMYQD